MRRLLVVVAATMLVPAAVADAARLPVYREPPSYKGRSKAPPTKPPPAPPVQPPVVLSDTGYKPDVLVDEGGTAHIVWAEDNGDGASTAEYCRLKRGATGCDRRATLVWTKDYGAGDGPQYNTDYGGPRIVRVGNQLVVFSKRYPTVADKPDGASSNTVVEWVSNDGGNTWNDNAQVVGKLDLGQMAVIGSENDPSILNVVNDPLCSAPGPASWCIQEYKSGAYSSVVGNLSTDSNQNYYAGVALDETGRPVSLATDAGGNAFARRWSGQGSVLDGTTWSPSQTFVADGPVLAGGPAGVWLMSKTTFNSGAFSVRRLNVNGDGTIAPGPATDVSANQDDIFAELFQDPSGRLHAAWEQRFGDRPGVKLRSSAGSGFGPELHLFDGQALGEISVGAAADGGGFAALARDVGRGNSGVVAVGFGTQAATGQPGLGAIPGGAGTNANVSCQKVDFGRFALQTAAGCLLEGRGKYQNLVVSKQEVTINGVRIVPDEGAQLIIDPRRLRIDTEGPVRVIVSGAGAEVVLFHGPLHTDLARVAPGANLFEFPSQAFKANVLGFPVAGDIPVKLTGDGVRIPVDLKLPPGFGGFTGHAELIANASGLQLDSLKLHAGPLFLGALELRTVDVDWRTGGNWSGHAELVFPAAGKFSADIFFSDGDFAGAKFDLPLQPPQAIGPFVYLLRVGGGFKLEPDLQIEASATVGAGAPIGDTAPVNVVGTFTMTFPDGRPASFLMHGRASIFVFSFADLKVEFQTDGYAQLEGNTSFVLGPIELGGKATAWVDAARGDFSAELRGGVKLCAVECTGAEAAAAFSTAGVAACGEIAGETVGLEMTWDELTSPETLAELAVPGIGTIAFMVDKLAVPCHTSDYFTPPPRPFTARSSAAGGQVVTIPRGLPSTTLVAVGESQAPDVTVTGPGGFRADGGLVFPRVPANYVVIENPKPGDYTIAPNEGSVDIVRVLASNGYRAAKVKAKVGKRSISYRVANAGNGQRVVFQERGRFGAHTLGVAKGARGRLRFKPASGPGGKRTVVALIQKDGFTTATRRVGTFRAPPPARPGAVKRLRAKHKAHRLSVSWRPARGANGYVVRLRGSKGTRLMRALGRRARSLKLNAVRRDERFTVSVQAIGRNLRAGPARSKRTR